MTWKPHWCEAAKKIADEHGWRLAENADGQLMFSMSESGPHVPIVLTEAEAAAEVADGHAHTAILHAATVLREFGKTGGEK